MRIKWLPFKSADYNHNGFVFNLTGFAKSGLIVSHPPGKKRLWVISHQQSGKLVTKFKFKTQRLALIAARELLKVGNWNRHEACIVNDKLIKDYVIRFRKSVR